MKIVCISDTHTRHDFRIPDGDLLIHAGDLTFQGSLEEIAKEARWLKAVRVGGGFKAAVVIPGNHDWLAEKDPAAMRHLVEEAGCVYLQHQTAEVLGLKIFGSGFTPRFFDWALNADRGEPLRRLWAQIPDDVQILVTHGPPRGILDVVKRPFGAADDEDYSFSRPGRELLDTHVGCSDLADRVAQLKDLKLHVFGHIHKPGIEIHDGVTYCNAAICDESYRAAHAPAVIEI